MADKVRVLIAEDHPIMREAIVHRLKLDGKIAVVGEASDGRELIDLYEQHRPDVVLVDVQMPGLNGIEATKAILERDPEARIIILSASSDRAAISVALAAGASGISSNLWTALSSTPTCTRRRKVKRYSTSGALCAF